MIADYFIECIKYTPTESKTARGKPYKSYTNTETINGYVGKRRQTQIVENGKTTIETVYNFYCDDFDLNYKDKILYNGFYYIVCSDPQNTANKNNHVKALLRKIENINQ